jgi:uncharacterized protein
LNDLAKATALGCDTRLDEDTGLEARLGREHLQQRTRLERTAEPAENRSFMASLSFSRVVEAAIPRLLQASGMLALGKANATRIRVVRNTVEIPELPKAFAGFTLLHLTDLHADISVGAMRTLGRVIEDLTYDACVITGDFRGRIFGPFDASLDLVREVVARITKPIYGVLGNHDTARMIPGLEAMGIRMLMNENAFIERGAARIWIAGVDDPHYYRTNNLARAMSGIAPHETTVLLSHSTDGFEAASHAGVALMLAGHTHGGQICLPGSIPVVTGTKMPRRLASGPWQQDRMHGYTSRGVGTAVIAVRFNCFPEVTLHRLTNARSD